MKLDAKILSKILVNRIQEHSITSYTFQLDLQRCKFLHRWHNISNSINRIYYINKLRIKTIWLSQQMNKSFWNNSGPIYDKNSTKWIPQYNQGHIWKATANVILKGEKLKVLPLRQCTRQACSLLATFIQHSIRSLAIVII